MGFSGGGSLSPAINAVAQAGPAVTVMPAKLYAAGHSYVSAPSTLAQPTSNRFTGRLAAMTRAVETNIAVGGTALIDGQGSTGPDNSPGGWPLFSSSVYPILTGRQAPVTGGKLLTPFGSMVLGWGINDVALMGITQFNKSFAPCLQAIINLARLGVAYDNRDASVSYDSSWAAITNVNAGACFNQGAQLKYTGTNGGTNTLALPSWYNGQAICAGFIAGNTGGTQTVTANKGAATLATTSGAGVAAISGRGTEYGLRVPAGTLPSGAQSITATVNNLASGENAFFEWWGIEADVPPAIFLLGQPRLPAAGYASYNTPAGNPAVPWPGAPVTDAHVAAINTALQTVAAQYSDGRVIYVPTDAAINGSTSAPADATKFLADGLHPNPEGNALIAGQFLSAVRTYYASRPAEAAYTGGL